MLRSGSGSSKSIIVILTPVLVQGSAEAACKDFLKSIVRRA